MKILFGVGYRESKIVFCCRLIALTFLVFSLTMGIHIINIIGRYQHYVDIIIVCFSQR